MAQLEKRFKANQKDLIAYIKDAVVSGSLSASLESTASHTVNGVSVTNLSFERYSYIGSNRLSLHVCIVGFEDDIYLSATTSGGSQAVFFKINTFGESSFLSDFESQLNRFIKNQ